METTNDKSLLADIEAEKSEFAKELELDKKIQAIDSVVVTILEAYALAGVKPQVLLCHRDNKEAAWWVANARGLSLIYTSRIGDNEIFVCIRAAVDALIKSREYAKLNPKPMEEMKNPFNF